MGHVAPGIVCGLNSERDALALGSVAIVRVAGARPEAAEAAARELAGRGVSALLSVGLAGALAPGLLPGDMLVPATILSRECAPFHSDAALASRLGLQLSAHRLLGWEEIVATPDQKRALLSATGADAVDMESHRIALVAQGFGLPFLAIRVIADPADRAIPPSASDSVRPDGSVDVARTLARLLARPQDLPALIRLGRDSGRAHRELKSIGRRLAAALSQPSPTP
ncbi:phosphorylase family protein [Thermaurantiacus sp.]